MTAPPSLLALLQADVFDEAELRALISSHFGFGQWAERRDVRYSTSHNGDPALTMIYDGSGTLTDIAPGPGLDQTSLSQLLETIDRERAVSGSCVARTFLFAAVPTRSWWRFAELAVIVPVPAGAAQPREVLAEHPFMLEVKFPNAVSFPLRALRSQRVLRSWELPLSLIIGRGIRSIGQYVTKRWVFVADDHDPPNIAAEFLQVGYFVPGYQPPADSDFSEVAGPSMKVIDDERFYTRRGISAEDVMTVPQSLPTAVGRFWSLSVEHQRRYLRACYWFQLADRQWELSHSASYQSLVQAVEALLPQGSVERCEECQRPLRGTTRAFKEFIEKYATGTTNAERDGFYALRSSVAHGALLFESDAGSGFSGIRPLAWEQRDTHGRMTQVAQIALVNYLLAG